MTGTRIRAADSRGVNTSSSGASRPLLSRRRLILFAVGLMAVAGSAVAVLVWMRPPEVQAATLATGPVERVLAVVGRVRPFELVEVRSPNPGQVIRLLKDDGDQVSVGEPLAVIRAVIEQAQTQAGLARERAARAELERARLAFNRTLTLASSGYAAQAALDEARAALQAAEAALDAARANTAASAALTGEFTVRAPMKGVILFRPIDNGQVVSPNTALFELGSMDGTEIQAQVDEFYADALRSGMPARAVLAGSDQAFNATVTEVSPKIDSATGGRLVKLEPVTPQNLPPGRSVDVTIVVESQPLGLVIPRTAIIDPSVAPKVYLLDEGDRIVEREIRLIRWPSLDAIVERGLSAGDRLVLDPARLRPGQRVRPVSAAEQKGG